MAFNRTAGLAGIGFVTTVVIANVVLLGSATTPDAGADPAEVARYYAENKAAIRFGSAVAPLAMLLIPIFAAGAFKLLREAGSAWSVVGLIGIAALVAIFSVVTMTNIALAAGSSGLWGLHEAALGLSSISLATALTGFSLAGLRTGRLRRWHGILGLTGAALSVVGAMASPWTAAGEARGLAPAAAAGFVIWLVWVVTCGVRLIRFAPAATATEYFSRA